MTDILSLSSNFPDADQSVWRELVEKALKGRAPETLDSRTAHGLPIRALYRETDWRSARDLSGFPGSQPFTRGGVAGRHQWLPWDIRQVVHHPDPRVAHDQIMEALENGVSSVEVRIDVDAEQGICIRRAQELSALMAEVDLELATVAIEAAGSTPQPGIELAAILAATVEKEKRASAQLAFNIDPIGGLARTGSLARSEQDSLGESAEASRFLAAEFPVASVLRVDARPVHEAGGTEVQELAYLAAAGAAYMRAAISAGMSASEANRIMLFTVAVGGDYYLEIAKLRAARRLWGRIAEAFGASGGMKLQAMTSRRMLTRRDPWNNLLRNTAACFAAGVGGADIVTVRTFTGAMGLPGPLARRMARNTQIIAQEESGLGKVIDPAGGAWAYEGLSEEIAQAAWSLFQEIEKEGGMIASLALGKFQAGVADARKARRSAVAHRKEWITGVNDFPLLDEEVPKCIEVDRAAIAQNAAGSAAIEMVDRDFRSLCAAASAGATIQDLSVEGASGVEADPFWPIRLAEPYEALRDLADDKRKKGQHVQVMLVALGPLSEHAARLGYAKNFFAAGGIETEVVDVGAGKEHLSASTSHLTCICGSDARYAEEAVETARALRDAGAGRIYLAGKPGENETALREAGVEEFIYVGVDVVASLELAHAELSL